MKLAFCLFKYFPYGGLQRDFLRIAQVCANHGHSIDVYTMQWEGDKPDWLTLHLVETTGWTNHQRCLRFSEKVNQILKSQPYDKIIGFNKMPGLDIYYAADGCFVTKPQYHYNWLKRLTRRYRVYKRLEKSLFSPEASTEILLLSKQEKIKYQHIYKTQEERLHLLPPGISRGFIPPENYQTLRQSLRRDLQVGDDEFLLIAIASSFHTKGVDRTIKAFNLLPPDLVRRSHLIIAGADNHAARQNLTQQNSEKITFLGARDDIPNLLFASDLLVHFARHDNTGTVILEALVAGVPVLTTARCGYARYIVEADAGMVIRIPFLQRRGNKTLRQALNPESLEKWRKNALAYSHKTDLFSLVEQVVEFIES